MENSQISNNGKLNHEVELADTAYGQGQIMVTTLNIALVYSALANCGNIMNPRLVIFVVPKVRNSMEYYLNR